MLADVQCHVPANGLADARARMLAFLMEGCVKALACCFVSVFKDNYKEKLANYR